MFGLGKDKKKCSELDSLIRKIEINMGNNYKDAAQSAFKDFENKLEELTDNRKLNAKQQMHYESLLKQYRKELVDFTHKNSGY